MLRIDPLSQSIDNLKESIHAYPSLKDIVFLGEQKAQQSSYPEYDEILHELDVYKNILNSYDLDKLLINLREHHTEFQNWMSNIAHTNTDVVFEHGDSPRDFLRKNKTILAKSNSVTALKEFTVLLKKNELAKNALIQKQKNDTRFSNKSYWHYIHARALLNENQNDTRNSHINLQPLIDCLNNYQKAYAKNTDVELNFDDGDLAAANEIFTELKETYPTLSNQIVTIKENWHEHGNFAMMSNEDLYNFSTSLQNQYDDLTFMIDALESSVNPQTALQNIAFFLNEKIPQWFGYGQIDENTKTLYREHLIKIRKEISNIKKQVLNSMAQRINVNLKTMSHANLREILLQPLTEHLKLAAISTDINYDLTEETRNNFLKTLKANLSHQDYRKVINIIFHDAIKTFAADMHAFLNFENAVDPNQASLLHKRYNHMLKVAGAIEFDLNKEFDIEQAFISTVKKKEYKNSTNYINAAKLFLHDQAQARCLLLDNIMQNTLPLHEDLSNVCHDLALLVGTDSFAELEELILSLYLPKLMTMNSATKTSENEIFLLISNFALGLKRPAEIPPQPNINDPEAIEIREDVPAAHSEVSNGRDSKARKDLANDDISTNEKLTLILNKHYAKKLARKNRKFWRAQHGKDWFSTIFTPKSYLKASGRRPSNEKWMRDQKFLIDHFSARQDALNEITSKLSTAQKNAIEKIPTIDIHNTFTNPILLKDTNLKNKYDAYINSKSQLINSKNYENTYVDFINAFDQIKVTWAERFWSLFGFPTNRDKIKKSFQTFNKKTSKVVIQTELKTYKDHLSQIERKIIIAEKLIETNQAAYNDIDMNQSFVMVEKEQSPALELSQTWELIDKSDCTASNADLEQSMYSGDSSWIEVLGGSNIANDEKFSQSWVNVESPIKFAKDKTLNAADYDYDYDSDSESSFIFLEKSSEDALKKQGLFAVPYDPLVFDELDVVQVTTPLSPTTAQI